MLGRSNEAKPTIGFFLNLFSGVGGAGANGELFDSSHCFNIYQVTLPKHLTRVESHDPKELYGLESGAKVVLVARIS
jgi:hypothetical protein